MDTELRDQNVAKAQARYRTVTELLVRFDKARDLIDPFSLGDLAPGWNQMVPPVVRERIVQSQNLLVQVTQDLEALDPVLERELDEAFTEQEEHDG